MYIEESGTSLDTFIHVLRWFLLPLRSVFVILNQTELCFDGIFKMRSSHFRVSTQSKFAKVPFKIHRNLSTMSLSA